MGYSIDLMRLPGIRAFVFVFTLSALCAGFSGCGGKVERPTIPPLTQRLYTLYQYDADVASYNGATTTAKRELRDKIINRILVEIEYFFRVYEGRLFVNRGSFNVAADFVELGLSTGVTLINPARTKAVLGALLSGATGTKLSIDKNFYREQTVQAILSSMEANRDKVKTRILLRMNKDDAIAYPLETAQSDLIEFFFAGRLQGGLQQLQSDSCSQALQNKTTLERQMVAPASRSDRDRAIAYNAALRRELAPGGDTAKVVAFLKAMGETVDDQTPTALMNQAHALALKTFSDPTERQRFFQEGQRRLV